MIARKKRSNKYQDAAEVASLITLMHGPRRPGGGTGGLGGFGGGGFGGGGAGGGW
jgi:uncharacterized protein